MPAWKLNRSAKRGVRKRTSKPEPAGDQEREQQPQRPAAPGAPGAAEEHDRQADRKTEEDRALAEGRDGCEQGESGTTAQAPTCDQRGPNETPNSASAAASGTARSRISARLFGEP